MLGRALISGGIMARRTILRVTVVLLALLAVPTFVFGDEISRVSIPVPIEIEGRPVHCPFYLKLEMKRYDIPFDQFATGHLGKAQEMFVTAVQAIRKSDVPKFASVWTAPNQMKGIGTTTISLVDNSPSNWMKQARSFVDFDNLRVVAQIQIGPDTVFVWDSVTKGRLLRNAFYVGLDHSNQLRLSAVSSDVPVEVMVLNAFVAAQHEPDAYKPLPNFNLRYEVPIPLDGNAAAGAHPVILEFDGSPMDFPLGDTKVKAPTHLLAFFRNAALADRNGKHELYASSFTPESADRVRQWLASMENRRKLTLQPTLTSSALGYVKFILNADPVFLVFQSSIAGKGWAPKDLTYSYVVREGRTYKIANFSSLTELDDFLQNPQFFDSGVLKTNPTSLSH